MYRRIIVPLDGSDLAEAILPHAEELARRFDAEVLLLRAVSSEHTLYRESAVPDIAPEMSHQLVDQRRQAEAGSAGQYLETVRARLDQAGIRSETRLAPGPAAAAIIEAAEAEEEPVLIAMSTHGRTGLGRLAFGSVADDVLRNVHVPIFLVRPRH
jgi:nucleotide-binding universal stress UspA family protein